MPGAVQQSSTLEEIRHPLVDQVKAWSDIAEAQYGEEGDMAGWSSDDNGPESSESQYLKVRYHFLLSDSGEICFVQADTLSFGMYLHNGPADKRPRHQAI